MFLRSFIHKSLGLLGVGCFLLAGHAFGAEQVAWNFEGNDVGGWGDLPAATAGDMSVSNPRVVDTEFYEGAKAFAFDFDSGSAGANQTQVIVNCWLASNYAIGMPYVQFAVKAPAQTNFHITIDYLDTPGAGSDSPILEQSVDNDWQLYTVPLLLFYPALDQATLQQFNDASNNWQNSRIVIHGDAMLGKPGISGVFYLDDLKFTDTPQGDVAFANLNNRPIGRFGDTLPEWASGNTQITDHPQVTADTAHEGVHSIRIPFATGAAGGAEDNVAFCNFWTSAIPFVNGATHLQFGTRSPVGTAYTLRINRSDGQGAFSTPLIINNVSDQWQLVNVPLNIFNPPLDEATMQQMRDGGILANNVWVDIYGDGMGGQANLTGNLHLDNVVFTNEPDGTVVPVELSSFSVE